MVSGLRRETVRKKGNTGIVDKSQTFTHETTVAIRRSNHGIFAGNIPNSDVPVTK